MSSAINSAPDFTRLFQIALSRATELSPGIGGKHLAEDIAQSVIAIIREHLNRGVVIKNHLAYARVITQRLWVNHLRKKYAHRNYLKCATVSAETDDSESPERRLSDAEERAKLRRVLLMLDTRDKVHLLAQSLGYTGEEVHREFYGAATSRTSLATVYYHRNRALKRAQELLSI